MQSAQVIVVGAGINGLCTAWQLIRRRPGLKVMLLDRFPAGHGRGSSHGDERIIRSSYGTEAWVRAMAYTRGELWPTLESDLGTRLIHPGGAVFWGPEAGPIGAYSDAVRAAAGAGAKIEEIGVEEARRRFPHMRFPDAQRALHDHEAGVIAAQRTLRGLEAWLAARGVHRESGRLLALEEDEAGVTLRLEDRTLRAQRLILCVGAWVRELVPSLAPRALPSVQHVGFWDMPVRLGQTPAWVYLGEQGLHYGLPALVGGMKAAFHRTCEGGDDPELLVEPDLEELDRVAQRLSEWFQPGPGRRLNQHTCLYTNHPEEEFVLEPPPGHSRTLAVSACSGHAFKLGPHTGERAAGWALDGLV